MSKIRLTFQATMALLAHVATVTAVCGGVWSLLYPDDLAKFIAIVNEKMNFYSEEIQRISQSSSDTADAAQKMVRHLSQRPGFEATLNMRPHTSSYTTSSQFVAKLVNDTPYTVRDLSMVFWGPDGTPTSSFISAVIPPFENHLDMDSREISRVCYSYVVDDGTAERITEERHLARTTQPIRDAMGNETTFAVFQTSYEYHIEENFNVMTCSDFTASVPLQKPR